MMGTSSIQYENMKEDTTLSKYQQANAIKKLVMLNLIYHQNRGLPQKRYFKINDGSNCHYEHTRIQ